MGRFNRVCLVGKEDYEFCPTCSRFDNLPRWMSTFCSQNCKDIFDIANDYRNNKLTKDEAKALLSALDLSRRDHFTGSIAATIDEILSDIPVKVADSKIEDNTVGKTDTTVENKIETPQVKLPEVNTSSADIKKMKVMNGADNAKAFLDKKFASNKR